MPEPALEQRIAMKAVIVNDDGKVLLLREAATYGDGTNRGKYHLPGGRVDPGEPFMEALNREVMEETGLEVEVERPVFVGEWFPVIRGTPNQIVGVFWRCRAKSTDVKLSEEHDDFVWLTLSELGKYDVMGPEPGAVRAALES